MYACLHASGNPALLIECARHFSPRIEETSDVRGLRALIGDADAIARAIENRVGLPVDSSAADPDAAILAARGIRGVTVFTPGSEAAILARLPLNLLPGSFTSVHSLKKAIEDCLDHNNENPKPFVWTADAELILRKIQRLCERISNSGHQTRVFDSPVARTPELRKLAGLAFAFATGRQSDPERLGCRFVESDASQLMRRWLYAGAGSFVIPPTVRRLSALKRTDRSGARVEYSENAEKIVAAFGRCPKF